MTRRFYLSATVTAAVLSATGFGAVAFFAPHPRLLWNATPSAPTGLYRLVPSAQPPKSTLVAIMPPPALADFMAARRYLPLGVPLLKHVAANPGARLCRHSGRVTVDGRLVAIAQARDSHGRPLPVWHGCQRLAADHLFLLNLAPDSMDGRYFGPLSDAGLLGCALPILTRDAAQAPLRWHGFGTASACFPSQRKETNHGDR